MPKRDPDDEYAADMAARQAALARDELLLWMAERLIPAARDATGWRLLARYRSARDDWADVVSLHQSHKAGRS